MKEKPYDLGYYNPIYRELLELFPNNSDKAIFDKFWHEYIARIRGNRPPVFQMSARDIERRTEIGHNYASKHIKRMVEIGILTKDDTLYSVAGDYVLSLLNAYRKLESETEQKEFRAAIADNNLEVLKTLGYEYIDGISSELKFLSTKTAGGYDSTQVDSFAPNRVNFNPPGLKSTQLGKILPTLVDDYREHIRKNFTISQILEYLSSQSGLNLTQVDSFAPTSEIFTDSETLSPDAEALLFIIAASDSLKGGLNLTQGVDSFAPRGGLKLTHRNIIKEDNKENNGMASPSYNKGVKESDDLNEEVVDEIPSEEIKRMDMGNYSQKKLKSQLPFYTSQEIQEILNNPQEAISSNDKLFIRVLWNVAKEQASVDQDDQEVEVDVEGYKFPADRFQRDILSPALEETNEIIETGMLRTEVENLPVELEELQPEQVELILDWETGRDSVGPFIVGSASRFHKIYSEPVEEPRRRRGRNSRNTEEREKAKEYFRNLLRCDDDGYDKLSQIEKAVFNFANEFLEVDWASGEVTGLADSEDLKEKFISPDHYTGFLAMLREDIGLNITREDFESVLNQAEPQPTGALDHIGETMFSIFSYEKIQTWIKKHSN